MMEAAEQSRIEREQAEKKPSERKRMPFDLLPDEDKIRLALVACTPVTNAAA